MTTFSPASSPATPTQHPHTSAAVDSPVLVPPPASVHSPQALEGFAAELLELGKQFDGTVTTEPEILATYSHDEAPNCPCAGAFALVRAKSVTDVQATMRFAYERGIVVVPQGARSGISGGANAVPGSILLSVRTMDRILNIDEANETVTVEPGIINQDLKDALRPLGLSYPPDPGSVAISTIGGNIATNAGGMCCVKYGVTRDFVREVKVVLPDGTLTRLGRKTAKGVAGLDLCGLFVGSEGTLGVIVEATLRLIPLPATPLTAVATFVNEYEAAKTVAAFMAAGYRPSLFEMMDHESIAMLNAMGDFGLDDSVGAMLIMQSDRESAAQDTEAFAHIAEENGAIDVAFSDNAADNDALIATRRMVQPSYEYYARAHGTGQLLEDVCVPRDKMPKFFEELNIIREETGVKIAVVAHAGDGNTHPAIFYDATDKASTDAAYEAFNRVMALGLSLGGTITGEHGVGFVKKEWLARELDEGARRLHREVKSAIDPSGIMNPGKMLHCL